MKIAALRGREIFDSRGLPTLECDLVLDSNITVSASVPAGASRGSQEAYELRDRGKRLKGKGVQKAIRLLEETIAPALVGKEVDALQLDKTLIELDGTKNKKNLGANTTLAVSMALYRAQAVQEQVELFELIAFIVGRKSVSMPLPSFNVINGGMHADNNLLIQEIMIVPLVAENFRESMECSVEVFHILKDVLKKKGKSTLVGDEGGFASHFTDEIEALNCVIEALTLYDKTNSMGFGIALDMAASHFYNTKSKRYNWHGEDVTADEMIEYYEQLVKYFPICSIEDALFERDWAAWSRLTKVLGDRMQIVGDDLFVTNPRLIAKGLKANAANAVIIKPNQIGTIYETLQAIDMCEEYGKDIIVSHRSGETEDTFIADLAVGSSAGQIKAGGCCRSDRMAKYNRLLKIEDIVMTAMMG